MDDGVDSPRSDAAPWSDDDDLEMGPQKTAEELLNERQAAAAAQGDVVDIDDGDAPAPPPDRWRVKPEAPKPQRKPQRKPQLSYDEEDMVDAPPAEEEPWWKKGPKKRPSKAPEALANELKDLSIAAAARAPRIAPLSLPPAPAGASRFAAFAHREGAPPAAAAAGGPPVPLGRAEAMIAQAAIPTAPELCDVPCTVDANRTKCTRSFHGVKVAFAFATPLQPQQNVMQRVVKAILKRETALLESPTGTGKTQALLSACLAAQRHLMLKGEKVGKIIYATRTIGQVKQLPGELRRNPYRASAAPLASRAHYCVNEAVKAREGDNARLSQACRKMAKAVEKFRGGGGDVLWDDHQPHKERQQTIGCPHYRALGDPRTAKTLHSTRPGCCSTSSSDIEDLAGVVNMDDLRKLANADAPGEESACAYHSATALAKRSHIIFCPYQYLMNPSIRQAMGIENYLEDAIAIVDEAHNVESVARDGGSFDKSLFDLAQLEDYCSRRSSVSGIKTISALHDVVQRLRSGLLEAQKAWCGPPRTEDEEEDDQKRYPCDISMTRRQRFRVSPDERDVVPGFDWGAADRRPRTLDFFATFRLSSDLLQRAHAEASVVAEEARNADGDEFIIGDQLEGLAGCLLLAYQQRTHYAICCRAWPNQSCERPKRFRDSLFAQDLQKLSGTEPAWGFELCCWLLHPGVVLDDLSKKVRCLVLASGTLAPLEQTERELGAEFSRRMTCKALQAKHVVCTRRQVLVRSVGSAGFESHAPVQLLGNAANIKKDDYRLALGHAIVKIVEKCPGGALVFLPSYKVLSSMRWSWKDDRMHLRHGADRGGRRNEVNTIFRRLERCKGTVLFEGRGNGGDEVTHEEVIADYKRAVTRDNSALLFCVYRGKCSEGISYNDDACRLVITVGIPYAPAFDHLVMRKRAYNDAKIQGGGALGMASGACDRNVMSGQTWYAMQAFRALNQALGRSIRHLNDYGALVLLDARFCDDPSARRNVAAWLRDAIQPSSLRDCARDCAAHFAPTGTPAFVQRDYRERMGLRALLPSNANVKPEAKPDIKPDIKPDVKPDVTPAPTVGELKARLRATGVPEAQIGACLEKRELVALLAAAAAPPAPPLASAASKAAAPAASRPPPAPPSQPSQPSQPFIYDLAGSSSDDDGAAAAARDAKRARLSEDSAQSLPSSFYCAISHSVMRDPVVCADGMTYERAYIESWLLAHDTSPLTNAPLASKMVVPNIALKQAIEEILGRMP